MIKTSNASCFFLFVLSAQSKPSLKINLAKGFICENISVLLFAVNITETGAKNHNDLFFAGTQ